MKKQSQSFAWSAEVKPVWYRFDDGQRILLKPPVAIFAVKSLDTNGDLHERTFQLPIDRLVRLIDDLSELNDDLAKELDE